jgi:outer membrane protein assembly factor BamE (lipoprotein component of BamABCDE complex)
VLYCERERKVERVANYGLEDGKLIDFVSRTTPTAGAESTFLKGMFINLLHF